MESPRRFGLRRGKGFGEGICGFCIDLFIIITGVLFALRLGAQRGRCSGSSNSVEFGNIANSVVVGQKTVKGGTAGRSYSRRPSRRRPSSATTVRAPKRSR